MQASNEIVQAQPKPALEPKIKVLIVDDSRLQRKIIAASLKRMGYAVSEADSGHAALDICKTWLPDLVLSDWMMPGMDGIEFCRAFKSLDREGYGYFILLTSKSGKDEVAEGLQCGADDFLSKPVNGLELRARLTAGERIVKMQSTLFKQTQIVSETLEQLRAVHDSLNQDLIEAKKLQQSLVREKHRQFSNASLSFMLHPAGHIGGDLVGYFPVSKQEVGFFAIDVSGHGVSSALMTARLAGYLTSPSPEQNIVLMHGPGDSISTRPLSDVVADLNRIVLDEMETDLYFTIILAMANMDTGVVKLCQAGHPHPAVHRKDGRIEQTGTGGLPVGLFPDAQFEEFQILLEEGDQMILASDGVTECPNAQDIMLGEEGFESLIRDLKGVRGSNLLEAIVWKLAEYSDDAAFPDDISAVLYEQFATTEA